MPDTPDSKPVPRLIDDEMIHENPYFSVNRVTLAMPAGNHASFYLRNEPDVAVCLPVDSEQAIILLEEYRAGPEKFLFEIAGGCVDLNEDPAFAAQREVLEETGYSGEIVHLASTYISAYSKARKHIYIMQNAKQVAEPDYTSSELASVVKVSLEEFLTVLKSGDLTDLDAGLACLNYMTDRWAARPCG